MTEMLQSIKSDLLSRRLLPALVVLGVVFVAAVAYAVAGGSSGGSPSSSPSSGGSVAGGSRALTVVVASANPNQAVSETPSGTNYQNKSPVHDPFVPLPSAPNAQTASSTAKASGSSAAGSSTPSSGSPSSGSGSSGSSGGSSPTPKPTPKPSKSSKPAPQAAYTVTVLFGLAPATPADAPKLTSYANLKTQAPLPSKQDVRIVFERVSASGTGAIFKLVQPPILHGQGQCFPNTSECEAVDLAVGQTEELEYVEASGQVAVYQLKVVSIAKNSASASAARVRRIAAAKAAREPSARTSLRLARRSRDDSTARRRHKIAG